MSTQYDFAEQWEFSAGRHWSQQPDCDVAHPARKEPNSGLAAFDEWERRQVIACQPSGCQCDCHNPPPGVTIAHMVPCCSGENR